MNKILKLYKRPSLASADNKDAVVQILLKKSEQFENDEARLKDYIGTSLNGIQTKINDLVLQKVEAEKNIKLAKSLKDGIKTNIALAFQELGINELTDKASTICSSLKIIEAKESSTELKEVALTTTEMKDLLKANGLSVTKMIEAEVEAKPVTIKANFKRGKGITELKPKDAEAMLFKRYELEDESE